MAKATGIVLELQRDCLDGQVSVATILRKAKVIASKLELRELRQWIDSELDGYECSMEDLPPHRKGTGQPKFHNPYNGWCPIMTSDDWFGQTIRTVFMKQTVSELEELSSGKKGDTLIMYYSPPIQEVLQKQLPMPMECGLHFSKTQMTAALDYIRNKMLDWTLELESKGVIGEGLSFGAAEKKDAQMVTNHIYGGNIGVLGNVAGDSNNSRFINSRGVDAGALQGFIDQALPASNGLDSMTRSEVQPLLEALRAELKADAKPGKISNILNSLRTILEGAGGNLVASALLAAMTGSPS
jgi:hypothetical protein